MIDRDIPFSALGHVTKGELRIDDLSFAFIGDIKKGYYTTLEKILNDKAE